MLCQKRFESRVRHLVQKGDLRNEAGMNNFNLNSYLMTKEVKTPLFYLVVIVAVCHYSIADTSTLTTYARLNLKNFANFQMDTIPISALKLASTRHNL